MTIEGVRKEGSNATSLEALTATAVTVYTVTTNKTFVLTDLIVTGRTTAITTPLTMPVVRFFDETAGESTAGAAANTKFQVNVPTVNVFAQMSTGGACNFEAKPLVITGLANGPAFDTEVSVSSIGFTHFVISAYSVWVGGYEY